MIDKNNELAQLKEMGIKSHLINRKCWECDQAFTQEDIENNNFSIIFENDGLVDLKKIDGSIGRYLLTAKIAKLTHEFTAFTDCPEVETCAGCDKKFLEKEVKRGIGEDSEEPTEDNNNPYYCDPCFNVKYGEYLKERARHKNLTQEQKEVMRTIQKALSEHLDSNYHHGGHDYSKCKVSECEGYKLMLESYGYEQEIWMRKKDHADN